MGPEETVDAKPPKGEKSRDTTSFFKMPLCVDPTKNVRSGQQVISLNPMDMEPVILF